MKYAVILVSLLLGTPGLGQTSPGTSSGSYDSLPVPLFRKALGSGKAYQILASLMKIGPRLSGSEQAAKATIWGRDVMTSLGFNRVRLQPVMVPHWVRGPLERVEAISGNGKKITLSACALGGSVGTPRGGIVAKVVEIDSWEELKRIGAGVKGKIVFYNRAMDKSLIEPGAAYGGAVDQRTRGAIEAARYGAVGSVIRSVTERSDDVPHTGVMSYDDSIPKIPHAALSMLAADRLHELLRSDPEARLRIELTCKTLPDAESANVIGEITGTEKPEEVVLIGAHLDSWDKGTGAHDDGAGCAHVIEALRLIREMGLRPKRTIRGVLFINEENGLRGGKEYAAKLDPRERHILAIESDAGGFSPQGFGISTDSIRFAKIARWSSLFTPIDADHFTRGGGGVDISPLTHAGIPSAGLNPDTQMYFDYHHSDNDVLSAVNERELELGAAALALLAYLVAQEGL